MDVTPDPATPDTGVSDALGALHALLLSTDDFHDFLVEVAGLAADLITPRASCGITTRYDGRPLTVATSDERAALLDEAQYGAAAGPCMHAMRRGVVVEVRDQAVDPRWPVYRQRAVALGVRCSLSVPLLVGGASIGALNLYAYDRPAAFTDADRRRALDFGERAATAIALARRHATLTETTRQMEEALRSRTVIDQAIGVLMAAEHCDATTAFGLLRAHSQNHNRKLRDVAVRVTERASGHRPTSPNPFVWDGDGTDSAKT